MKLIDYVHFFALVIAVCSLSACESSSPDITDPPQKQAAAIISQGGTYKVGNPYKILGRWYYPKEDYSYSEVGTASWYGPDFHAKRTANGEKYDMYSLTAAHRTLPLPSIVRVTNLENGRSLVVRVNDRGPYARNRIIDVSKKVAQLLGFLRQGTTKVKVEVLEKESKNLKAALTGNPVYADVSAAPVAQISSSTISPIVGSNVAQTNEATKVAVIETTVPATASNQPEITESVSVANVASQYEVASTASDAVSDYANFTPDYDYDPEAEPAKARAQTSAKIKAKATSSHGYYVQAGAFTSRSSAEKLSKKLAGFGNSHISSARVNGKLFYRVRVGPYAKQSGAIQAQSKIRRSGITTAANIVED